MLMSVTEVATMLWAYVFSILSAVYAAIIPNEPSDSILPFIPRPVKYALLFLAVFNCRSWPFTWHVRVWRPLIWVGIRKGVPIRLSCKARANKIWDSICPIGVNPLDREFEWKSWASPDECDYNFHLSNSSYAKNWDSARFKQLMEDHNRLFADGGRIAIAGTYYHFVKEIPILSTYSVRSSIVAWDNKWIYTMTRFVTAPKRKAMKQNSTPNSQGQQQSLSTCTPLQEKHLSRSSKRKETSSAFTTISTNLTVKFLFDFAAKQADKHTVTHAGSDSTNSSTSTTPGSMTPDISDSDSENASGTEKDSYFPSQKPQLTSVASDSSLHLYTAPGPERAQAPTSLPPTEADGSTIHCIALSRCCWKFGRITIPPALALTWSGYCLTPEEWEKFRAIRDSGGLKKFLQGGWKEIPEGERWWEAAMGRPEIEERRVRGMQIVGMVKEGMDSLISL